MDLLSIEIAKDSFSMHPNAQDAKVYEVVTIIDDMRLKVIGIVYTRPGRSGDEGLEICSLRKIEVLEGAAREVTLNDLSATVKLRIQNAMMHKYIGLLE